METVKVPGYSQEDMLAEMSNLRPPMRPDGFGLTATEIKKNLNVSPDEIKDLAEVAGYVRIRMRGKNGGRFSLVYVHPDDAEPYTEWIVKE